MAYKYPYIPKDYYPAVMFACKLIRENGYFNQAISKAADYYRVDENILAHHVRKRQGAGQKWKSRKYKWYVILGLEDFQAYDDVGTLNSWSYTEEDFKSYSRKFVVKALNSRNAELQAMDKMGSSDPLYPGGKIFFVDKVFEFDSKDDADKYCDQITWDFAKQYIIPKNRLEV